MCIRESVNPLGSAVLFAALAGKFDPGIQRRMANSSALAVLIILLVCAWLGNSILGLMGLTTPMLQAAGGIILLNYGLRMVTVEDCLLYTSPSPRDRTRDRMPSSACKKTITTSYSRHSHK